MNKTESELTQLNRNTQREGSHEVLINQIGLYFSQNSLENRTFNNLILQLKRMRKNADYMNVMIDFSLSNNALSLSKNTLKELKKLN